MVLSQYRAMKSIPFGLAYVRFLNADGNCICPRSWPVIGLVLNVILSVSLINLMRFTHMNIFLHLRKPKLLQVVLCLLFGVLEPYLHRCLHLCCHRHRRCLCFCFLCLMP